MYVRDGVPPEKGLTKERIKMDVKKMRFPTPGGNLKLCGNERQAAYPLG
jgi:hypothetical protein